MKYREILLEQLKSLPYFNKSAIYQLSKQYGLKNTTVDSYIGRSLKSRDITQFKKGLYTTTNFYENNRADISYKFYLANVLRTPSYVSSWAALQYYELTTEAIQTITSVTPKVTRDYQTRAGSFGYNSIKKELFSGFSLVNPVKQAYGAGGKFDFFIASPSKALFDLLYFKTRQFRGVKLEMVDGLISDLRIDIEEMDKKEQDLFYEMIKKYLNSDE
jgi:hypothetical protein